MTARALTGELPATIAAKNKTNVARNTMAAITFYEYEFSTDLT